MVVIEELEALTASSFSVGDLPEASKLVCQANPVKPRGLTRLVRASVLEAHTENPLVAANDPGAVKHEKGAATVQLSDHQGAEGGLELAAGTGVRQGALGNGLRYFNAHYGGLQDSQVFIKHPWADRVKQVQQGALQAPVVNNR